MVIGCGKPHLHVATQQDTVTIEFALATIVLTTVQQQNTVICFANPPNKSVVHHSRDLWRPLGWRPARSMAAFLVCLALTKLSNN